eukprot:SM000207S06176  [mRNA]  locus=s207:171931:175729:+ [translate_table: standard]
MRQAWHTKLLRTTLINVAKKLPRNAHAQLFLGLLHQRTQQPAMVRSHSVSSSSPSTRRSPMLRCRSAKVLIALGVRVTRRRRDVLLPSLAWQASVAYEKAMEILRLGDEVGSKPRLKLLALAQNHRVQARMLSLGSRDDGGSCGSGGAGGGQQDWREDVRGGAGGAVGASKTPRARAAERAAAERANSGERTVTDSTTLTPEGRERERLAEEDAETLARELRAAAALDPSQASIWNNLGLLLAHSSRHKARRRCARFSFLCSFVVKPCKHSEYTSECWVGLRDLLMSLSLYACEPPMSHPLAASWHSPTAAQAVTLALADVPARAPRAATPCMQSAVEVFQGLLSAMPDHVDALANLGACYLHLHDIRRAEQCLQAALLRDSSHVGALTTYSALLLAHPPTLSALSLSLPASGCYALPSSLYLSPSHSHHTWALASRPEDMCVFTCVSILYDSGAAAEGLRKDGQHARAGSATIAQRCLEAALMDNTRSGAIWTNLGAAFVAQGKPAAASRCLEQAALLEPRSLAVRLVVARQRVRDAGRCEDPREQLGWAANEMASLLREKSSVPLRVAWAGLALVNRAQSEAAAALDEEDAVKEYEERVLHTLQQAAEEEPSEAAAWQQLGEHALSMLQFGAAQAYLKSSIGRCGTAATAWSNLGIAVQLSEDPGPAEAVYKRALKLAGPLERHAVLSNLGNLYRQQRRFPEAHDVFAEALELCREFAPACNNLGLLLVAQERWDEAIAAFDRALASDPSLDAAKSNGMKAAALAKKALEADSGCADSRGGEAEEKPSPASLRPPFAAAKQLQSQPAAKGEALLEANGHAPSLLLHSAAHQGQHGDLAAAPPPLPDSGAAGWQKPFASVSPHRLPLQTNEAHIGAAHCATSGSRNHSTPRLLVPSSQQEPFPLPSVS